MQEFLLLYRGGARPSSEAAGRLLAGRWGTWLRHLAERGVLVTSGDPLVGGRLVGTSANMQPDTDYISGPDHIGGYSRIRAAHMDEAAALCADCPILGEGGFIELRQVISIAP